MTPDKTPNADASPKSSSTPQDAFNGGGGGAKSNKRKNTSAKNYKNANTVIKVINGKSVRFRVKPKSKK